MEESCLRGNNVYCCFVDFEKIFDMVTREHLWRSMEELGVPSEDIVSISQIYWCQTKVPALMHYFVYALIN